MVLAGVRHGASSNLAALNAAAMGDALAKRYKNVIPTEMCQVGVQMDPTQIEPATLGL